jgi:NADPH:quinone reductase
LLDICPDSSPGHLAAPAAVCERAGVRAVLCHELGPPERLAVEYTPDPEPGPHQVLVAVEAAGVNYVDALFIEGRYQIKPPLPFTPGSEVAGTVAAVGEGVTSVAAGDRVAAMCGLGGYSSHVVLSELSLLTVPPAVSATQAATLIQSYATALFALRERAALAPGEVVLVLGGAGGVGIATIDVARALGAQVIAAASTEEKRAACLAAGAASVIDYGTEDLKARARELAGGDGVDVVVDPVGGDHSEAALRALRVFGRLVVIGFAAGEIPRLPLNQVLLRNRSILGVDWGAWGMQHAAANRALVEELFGWAGEGRIHPPEPTTYPLEEVADALRDLTGRRLAGKAALVP